MKNNIGKKENSSGIVGEIIYTIRFLCFTLLEFNLYSKYLLKSLQPCWSIILLSSSSFIFIFPNIKKKKKKEKEKTKKVEKF